MKRKSFKTKLLFLASLSVCVFTTACLWNKYSEYEELLASHDPDGCIEAVDKAFAEGGEDASKDPELYLYRAEAYRSKYFTEEAYKDIEKAHSLGLADGDYHLEMAKISLAARNPGRAFLHIGEAEKTSGRKNDVAELRTTVEGYVKHCAYIKLSLERALEKADTPEKKDAIKVRIAKLKYYDLGDPVSAVADLRQIIKSSSCPDAQDALAWILMMSDDRRVHSDEKALTAAQELVALNPRNPIYLDTLAAAYAANGDFKSAANVQRKSYVYGIDSKVFVAVWPVAKQKSNYEERMKLFDASLAYRERRGDYRMFWVDRSSESIRRTHFR